MKLQTLSVEDVINIHEELVNDFARQNDPISPAGVRSMHLLESAVSRQFTSIGEYYKYPDPISNAATLLYGICNDHPFHNGNKRAALVAMLVHLDKNKWTFFDTKQDELYTMILSVADHTIGMDINEVSQNERRNTDEEVKAIISWMKDSKLFKVVRGEQKITYKELRKHLAQFKYTIDNPARSSIDVLKYAEIDDHTIQSQKIGSIIYLGENNLVPIKMLKKVRTICRLREIDGVDTDTFYYYAYKIESFVNRYRKTLQKLAVT